MVNNQQKIFFVSYFLRRDGVKILFFLIGILLSVKTYSQCCAAGSGSPIAGDASQGVLQDRQLEINTNFQYIATEKFLTGDSPAPDFLKKYYSNYNYLRLAYGITKKLTLSVESGYYFSKTQVHLNSEKAGSSGIGDLIIFPRYNVYNHTEECKRVELTLGLGLKIPIGKYNDSIGQVEPFSGTTYYVTLPPAVQPTTGSNDFIFYLFAFRGFPDHNFNVFVNSIYVKKGWNPLGEKFGNYASIGLFAGKTLYKKLGILFQVKGEWIDKMKFNEDTYLMGSLNYDVASTGSKKIFLVPQVNYTFGRSVTLYAFSEFPIYQYVTGTQIASQFQITTGISYRFFTAKSILKKKEDVPGYVCPMRCKGSESDKPGKCGVCDMDLEKIN